MLILKLTAIDRRRRQSAAINCGNARNARLSALEVKPKHRLSLRISLATQSATSAKRADRRAFVEAITLETLRSIRINWRCYRSLRANDAMGAGTCGDVGSITALAIFLAVTATAARPGADTAADRMCETKT